MSSRKMCVVVIGLVLLSAVSARAQYTVELDLDDHLGNGPDTVCVEVGEDVWADVWIHGPEALWHFGVWLCNLDRCLQFRGWYCNLPPSWTIVPPPPWGECELVQGVDLTIPPQPISLPWMVCRVRYLAAVDQCIADLTIGAGSGVGIVGGETVYFNSWVDAAVRIGATSVEESSWGAIKSLFR
ncbi:MAG: hypothetical protein FJY73_03840 [Candidatus Eisenbacteria bacterium]|nr:hypothetical protein [Candidatus Eisenbacteria bacterium]